MYTLKRRQVDPVSCWKYCLALVPVPVSVRSVSFLFKRNCTLGAEGPLSIVLLLDMVCDICGKIVYYSCIYIILQIKINTRHTSQHICTAVVRYWLSSQCNNNCNCHCVSWIIVLPSKYVKEVCSSFSCLTIY